MEKNWSFLGQKRAILYLVMIIDSFYIGTYDRFVFLFTFCRFWSLYDAMYHSSYMSSKLVVYKTAGHNKLQVREFDDWLIIKYITGVVGTNGYSTGAVKTNIHVYVATAEVYYAINFISQFILGNSCVNS